MQHGGLYIHVPFCLSKCPYCDFYSVCAPTPAELEAYTRRVCVALKEWAVKLPAFTADTLYFGGGTPALLGGAHIAEIIATARACFGLPQAEITLEANPADNLQETLAAFAAAGGNRLSLGMQSAVPQELKSLGRRHTPADVQRTVSDARRAGLSNISLDLMLGISGQTPETALHSVATAVALGATHLSAYMLKIEPHTPYARQTPVLPDEDATADIYLAVMEILEAQGYRQYEISNAARTGCESRHNLKYWHSLPYLGIGPAASSCINGRRFAYSRDLAGFIAGQLPQEEPDSLIAVGSPAEYALLRLRLAEGLTATAYRMRFGEELPSRWRENARLLPSRLVQTDAAGIRLTREGFLLSNALISHIIEE